MRKPVSNDEFKDILLLNMPESWTTFTTSYMAGRLARKEASSVTVEQLTAVLVDKYKHQGSTSPGQTLIARLHDKRKEPGVTCSHCGRDNHSTDQCHHKGKPKCGYCHRIGHTEDRCWTKDGRGPPKRAKTAQTNFASTLEIRDVQDDEQVLMVDGQGASSNNNNIYSNSFTVNWKDGIEESIAFYTWVTDTSSSVHLTNTRDVFITPVHKVIKGIGDHAVIAEGIGTVELQTYVTDKTFVIALGDVYYVPSAVHSILSLTRLDRDGGSFASGHGQTKLYSKDGTLFAISTIQDGIYMMKVRQHEPPAYTYQACTWNEWHQWFRHIGICGLQCLHDEQLVDGLDVLPSNTGNCCACIEAKQSKLPFPCQLAPHTTQPGELIHTDVWGPAHTVALTGHV